MNTSALIVGGELATSVIASTTIATAVNTEPLTTALITFGVSLVTLVGGEFVKYLIALLKKKTKELEDVAKNDDEKGK